ncbi:hypothetical protein DPMN_191905 [Dreissena polymorpha]|uniref:Uncharacterized protein n=1 Tax=Dreissena polymorpha TaxID=45954 RepID=A0A9D3XZJ4_DREPO|nr:hypothetical protein DPMN_191905 [Dreissena polymorpha]
MKYLRADSQLGPYHRQPFVHTSYTSPTRRHTEAALASGRFIPEVSTKDGHWIGTSQYVDVRANN